MTPPATDELIAFVAKGASDIDKWLTIAHRIKVQRPACRFLIISSVDVSPSPSADIRVLNIYAEIDATMQQAEKDPAGFVRKGGELAGLVAPDTFKADERFIFRTASTKALFAEQCHVAERVRDVFRATPPGFLFVAGAGVLLRTVTFAVARALGIRAYRVLGAHHMNPGRKARRYFFCDNDLGGLPAGAPLFRHHPAALDAFVADFVERLRVRDYQFDTYSKTVGRSWRMSASVREAFTDLMRIPWAWGRNDYLSMIKLWRRFVYYARYSIQRHLFQSELPAGMPFVIFPLNVPDDAQLNLRAKEWVDLEATIRIVAANLPSGIQLVVKPHPGNPGMLASSLIRRLRSDFPDLVFLSPDAPLLPLVQRAVGVIVVNGSIALEAALLGKPVFHLGRYFYSALPNCIPVTSFADFAGRVATAMVSTITPCPDTVRQLLRAYYGFTYPLIGSEPCAELSIVDTISDGITTLINTPP
jgi:hypothetical protein